MTAEDGGTDHLARIARFQWALLPAGAAAWGSCAPAGPPWSSRWGVRPACFLAPPPVGGGRNADPLPAPALALRPPGAGQTGVDRASPAWDDGLLPLGSPSLRHRDPALQRVHRPGSVLADPPARAEHPEVSTMEHHASFLAVLLTNLLGLARHPWGTFAHGEPLSVLERYDHLLISAPGRPGDGGPGAPGARRAWSGSPVPCSRPWSTW